MKAKYSKSLKPLMAIMVIIGCIFMLSAYTHPYEPQVHIVKMKDSKFVPKELTIKKGDTVKWINEDFVFHDVTDRKKKSWKSGQMAKDAVWKQAITKSADYYCSLHIIMEGKIIVK